MSKEKTAKEKTAVEPAKSRWAIDLDWFPRNNRSISVLLGDYVCADCAKKLSGKKKPSTPEALITTIKNCCAKRPDFINEHVPILEGVFRLFLRKGNQPMELEELGHELGNLRGGDTYRTSPEALLRILRNDGYYGLREVEAGSTR
jgi:hypothetical protein